MAPKATRSDPDLSSGRGRNYRLTDVAGKAIKEVVA
jgi:hypothetical protein